MYNHGTHVLDTGEPPSISAIEMIFNTYGSDLAGADLWATWLITIVIFCFQVCCFFAYTYIWSRIGFKTKAIIVNK